jgi:uncharacterized damage-inducible protein DinB
MTQTKRLIRLYSEHFDGTPWLDTSLYNTLHSLEAKQAARYVSKKLHSIWEITEHLISWRMHILRRLQGEDMRVTRSNYFKPIKDTSEKAWQNTLSRLRSSQEQWLEYLKNFNDKDLDKINPNVTNPYYYLFEELLLHDTYHLGQIMLILKLM